MSVLLIDENNVGTVYHKLQEQEVVVDAAVTQTETQTATAVNVVSDHNAIGADNVTV